MIDRFIVLFSLVFDCRRYAFSIVYKCTSKTRFFSLSIYSVKVNSRTLNSNEVNNNPDETDFVVIFFVCKSYRETTTIITHSIAVVRAEKNPEEGL